MTDLEMTRLCAEAMGYDEYSENVDAEGRWYIYLERDAGIGTRTYWPISDDEQAMALLKKFPLHTIDALVAHVPYGKYDPAEKQVASEDWNRVIVECVAMRQKAKQEHDQGGFMKNVRGPTVAS